METVSITVLGDFVIRRRVRRDEGSATVQLGLIPVHARLLAVRNVLYFPLSATDGFMTQTTLLQYEAPCE